MNTILKEVENDKVEGAFNKIEERKLQNKFSGVNAYYTIVSLNGLVSPALRNKKSCSSNCKNIFKLTELCCEVESMWEYDQIGCMQCLYHLMRYFLLQEEPLLAKKVCEFFFSYCKKEKKTKWDEKEHLIFNNTVIYFSYYLYDVNKQIISDQVSDRSPFVTWFKFLLKINEFSDFSCSTDFFQLCYSLTKRSQSLDNRSHYHKVITDLIEEFVIYLRKLLEDNRKWTPKVENIVFSTSILSDVLCDFEKDNCHTSHIQCISKFIECLKDIVISYSIKDITTEDIELLENAFNLFASGNDKSFESAVKQFYKTIQKKKQFALEIYPFIFNCLSVLRSKIRKVLEREKSQVVNMVKIIFGMFSHSLSKSKDISSRKGNELLHAFTAAMYLFDSMKLDSSSLKDLYNNLRVVFREFNHLVTHASKGQSIFEYGVCYCINIIQLYKNAELYTEMANLSRDLIKFILQLNRDFLPVKKYEMKIGHLLNNFVVSYGKINLGVDAQIGLLAFAGVHPQFIDIVFKYWAELKVNFPQLFSSAEKKSTCFDIITTSKSDIEENWPPCSVESINIEQSLLEEIKAYAKHRDLQVEPVIAVYRTSFKIIKDKLILAQILTAAVDCIATDEYIFTLNNLYLSLKNMIGSLSRLKEQTTDKHKLCQINCLIGDVLYQQMRCDIAQQRKKAEDELELLNVPSKKDVPVFEEEASNITPAYSYLKLDDQHIETLAENMSKVLSYWSDAASLATPEDNQLFSFRYLKGLAYTLRLYDFKSLEVEAWKLMYSFSKTFSAPKYKILAVAELLAITFTVDQKWIIDAEETLKKEDSLKKCYVYTLFIINRAKNCYLNRKYEEAIQLSNDINEDSLKKCYLLNIQHKMLIFLLKFHKGTPCSSRSEPILLDMKKSFEYLVYSVKMKTWRTFSEKCVVQHLLLDVSLAVVKTYLDLRMIRHASSYGKKQLTVAQKLALPIWVSEFLTVLSTADLLTGNFVEASQKLNGLDTILGLDHIILPEADNDICEFSRTSSKADIKRPKFLLHVENCSCFVCNSIDLLSVILNSFTLKTIYTSSNNAEELARYVSSIGNEIIAFGDKKGEEFTQTFSVADFYNESKVRFYIHLSYTYMRWGEMDNALAYNKIALETLKVTACNEMLMTEIVCQLITLNWSSYVPPQTAKYAPKIYGSDNLPVETARTPETCKPVRSVVKHLRRAVSPISCKIPITPQPMMHVKKLFLDVFEKELDGKYKRNDKENIESSDTSTLNISTSGRSPLAEVLATSPKLAFHNRLIVDENKSSNSLTPKINSNWVLETPKTTMKVSKPTKSVLTKTRQAQIERKGKKILEKNLFSTPFENHGKPPEIKIFCDDTNDRLPLASTRNRKKCATTAKKAEPKTEKNIGLIAMNRRKLAFDSDSDDDLKTIKESSTKIRSQLGRRLFDKKEEPTIEVVSTENRTSTQSNDSAIIEPSFMEECSSSQICGPNTPRGLEESLKQLSLSGKKMVSLSTKKMTRIKNIEQTPTLTSESSRSSSRLNVRSTRKK